VDHSSIVQIGCPSEAVSLFRFAVSFYISQLFQFGHFHYLLFCTQHQPQASLLASSGMHCSHRMNLPCRRYHTAMSHSTTPAEIQLDKQELHEFVDKSSKWCMKTKGNVKEYATIFWYCCDPLITSHYMSLGECKELFWQGFHPDTRAQFPPDAKQQIWDILQRTPTNDLVVSTPAVPADPSCHGLPRLLNSLLPISLSRSVPVRDSGPLCPMPAYLSMDCSRIFQRLPYVSLGFYLVLWPSLTFS